MFEGFDTGSPWSDEEDQPEPPPPPWYIQVLILATLAAIVWAIYEGIKEDLGWRDIPKLFEMYKENGYDGVAQYVADKRDIPNKKWRDK
jgi:hypothetical protein